MQRSPDYYWTPEQVAIIKEFAEKYPKGKGVDMRKIKWQEPEKLKLLLDGGRTMGAIYHRGAYERGYNKPHVVQAVKAKAVKAKAPQITMVQPSKAVRLDPAWNFCPTCGHNLH